MSRLKPSEIAVILERMRKEYPNEIEKIEEHIDSVETEDALLSVVREMIESKEQSKAAEAETARILNSWKPTMDASAAALGKLAEEEGRRNDLKKRELDRQDKLDEQGDALTQLKYHHVVVPIVTAITGAFAAWAALAFGG
tara:strand:+ start:1883 stop:2305 length:423 start_codon:yes stop_codon:yes gene_type:complete